MKNIEEIKRLLQESRSDEVIRATDGCLSEFDNNCLKAEILYLRGSAFRQKGDWKQAMNAYLRAIELDPESPAAESYKAAEQVLGYYHKDYYNP